MATKSATVKDNAWKMGDEFVKMSRNVWLAGLGAVSLAEEETRSAFDNLINRGENFEKSDRNVMSKAFDRTSERAKKLGSEVEDKVQQTVSNALQRAGVPSRDEIRRLIDRVEELNQKIEKLSAH